MSANVSASSESFCSIKFPSRKEVKKHRDKNLDASMVDDNGLEPLTLRTSKIRFQNIEFRIPLTAACMEE